MQKHTKPSIIVFFKSSKIVYCNKSTQSYSDWGNHIKMFYSDMDYGQLNIRIVRSVKP